MPGFLESAFLMPIGWKVNNAAAGWLSHQTCTKHAVKCALKMIIKGFVLFKMSKSANPKICLCCPVMTSSHGRIKTFSMFFSTSALNLIFGMLSAQFKFNNNVERW